MAQLHLEALNVFQFRAFTPNSLHHLHGTNCILADNGEGKFSCLDIVSGDELCAKGECSLSKFTVSGVHMPSVALKAMPSMYRGKKVAESEGAYSFELTKRLRFNLIKYRFIFTIQC